MAEYIDRAKAFCLLRDELPDILGGYMPKSDVEHEARKVLSCLRSVPVENVAPVKHGKWNGGSKFGGVICSCCGYGNIIMLRYESKYCPACGAKMDLKE